LAAGHRFAAGRNLLEGRSRAHQDGVLRTAAKTRGQWRTPDRRRADDRIPVLHPDQGRGARAHGVRLLHADARARRAPGRVRGHVPARLRRGWRGGGGTIMTTGTVPGVAVTSGTASCRAATAILSPYRKQEPGTGTADQARGPVPAPPPAACRHRSGNRGPNTVK